MGSLRLETSNLDIERNEKMKQGRIQVIRKVCSGFEEEENSLQALEDLTDLNVTLTDKRKVMIYLQAINILN